MSIKESIKKKIQEEFDPTYLEVVNESHKHRRGNESHFKLLVVSQKFANYSRVDRQRWVHRILNSELSGPVHALSQRLLTPEEWSQSSDLTSPNCIHLHVQRSNGTSSS